MAKVSKLKRKDGFTTTDIAIQEATDCFNNRDLNAFMTVNINSKYPYYRKRHFLVYKHPSSTDAWTQAEEKTLQYLLPFNEMQIPLLNNTTGTISNAEARIIEKVEFNGQLWLYIQTERPLNTFTVCKSIALICNLDPNGFFTDELPIERSQMKRYDYIKIKMFKLCLSIIRRNETTETAYGSNAE